MKIRNARLKTKVLSEDDFPDSRLPEIAFLGRSNVGKSSLLNALLNRRDFARTSSTPGKTRGIYFYLINHHFFFVDLPGYGYAKVSKKERLSWGPLMERYLGHRTQLRLLVHIVDIRHSPSALDLMMVEWLYHYQKPFLVVATKADKISRGKRRSYLHSLREEMELPQGMPMAFSAKDKTGVTELWDRITELVPDILDKQ